MPGAAEDAASSLVRSGVLDADELAGLTARGAVGDLVVHPFDATGAFVAPELAARAIAIGVDDLRRTPRVVAVASGAERHARSAAPSRPASSGSSSPTRRRPAPSWVPADGPASRPRHPHHGFDRDRGRDRRRCGAEGASVFIVSRTADHAKALAARSRRPGRRPTGQPPTSTSEAEIDAAVTAAVERFGRIDGLFSVAGGSGRRFGDGRIHTVTAEAWEATADLNLRTQILACARVVRACATSPRTTAGPAARSC